MGISWFSVGDKITITQILLLLLVHFSPQSDKTVHVFLAFLGELSRFLTFNILTIITNVRNFDLLCTDSVGFALALHITGPCLGYWGSYVQVILMIMMHQSGDWETPMED